MPRKWLKQRMPDKAALTQNKSLGVLQRWIHDPNLWHLTRHSASMAFLVGTVAAFVPLPLQMLLAAIGAILFRCNLPIAVALTWATNPITTPPLVVLSLQVGGWVLGRPATPVDFEFTWDWLTSVTWTDIEAGFATLMVGSVICGIVFGVIGMIGIRLLWRWHVVQRWEARKRRRSAQS
jgi:uncharacterized protein